MDLDRLAELATAVDRHEKALVEIKAGVAASISGVTGRLDAIERKTMDQAEKIDHLVNETAGQSVLLEEIKGMVCNHKDEQAVQIFAQGTQLTAHTEQVGKLEGKVAALSAILRGEEADDGKGGIVGDLAVVKRAVVHGPVQITAMRAYRVTVAVAVIVGCTTLCVFPQLVPLLCRLIEAHLAALTH